ncbi:thiol:disulfide interchange protein DsbA/DsbL [Gallaecimonas sp. GXIMD1310]|uniref:thiol:disulfide interchange protein DsbA/DsbL n=1 Tax=Gallaecimonas sp. GXIMD1310 TaxID=3131926 RepID=UPI00324F2E4B
MKKLMLVVLALCLAPAAFASQFKEGVNYTVLDMAAPTPQPQVTEYFSLFCPHCYHFEEYAEQLRDSLPKGVEFKRNHVDFVGGPMGKQMSRAYAVMQVLGVDKKVVPVVFDFIHKDHLRPSGMADIRKMFEAAGVSGKDFDAAVNSFSVNARLAQMEHNTVEKKIRGVPAIVVNGKYLVNLASLTSKDNFSKKLFQQRLDALVKYLAEKKG